MPGMRLIAGSGRSGTTWVQDALAVANDLRPIFEPLHPAVSEIGARYAYRALSANELHPELQGFLTDGCSGRKYAIWTRYRGRPDLLFPSLSKLTTVSAAKLLYHRWRKFLKDMPELSGAGRRREPLLKCIRANLMLGWLARQCDARIVLVVRHPGAVVESQLRLGAIWDPDPVLTRFRNDHRLHELTGNRYRRILDRRLTVIEALTLNWVIENQWPIDEASGNGVTVVFYERLKASPDREWQRVCQALDLPIIPGSAVRARPSQQSSQAKSLDGKGADKEPRWLRALTPEQVGLMDGVLEETQFRVYRMSVAEPHDAIGTAMWNHSEAVTP